MIELRLLEQLAAFAEYGTLSSAAQHLHTSQPAMTRSMKKLEDELGVTLFIHGKNHLTLSETGLYAAEYARRVLEAEQDFRQHVHSFDRSLHTISIGFCAPVPQEVLTPILNSIFEGMTISSDMKDDRDFPDELLAGNYQLAVMHTAPEDPRFYSKKCGHEDLSISLLPSHPLATRTQIELEDLDGLSILLLSRIGFWANMHRQKTPHTRYLLQIESSSFSELASNSNFPVFSSSYYLRRGESIAGRVNIPISDPECHTDYFLVCLREDLKKYLPLFEHISESTIR